MRYRWLTLPLVVLVAHPSLAADDALTRSVNGRSFDQFVQATLEEYNVPGAVVVVASSRGTVFLKGYGVRRQGAPEPVDENTRFQLASLSKFIAATAVGTLVDRGVVAWDRPLHEFVPDFALAVPYATDQATLRDFLAHRTGLPAYGGDLLTKLGYSPNELMRRARYLPFGHSFRAKWAYSNYGIFLGQTAAAQAAGLTPPDLLQSAIFNPLGMTRSGPVQSELFKDENHVAAHDVDLSILPHDNVDAFSGAGAAVSTGADMARWMQMLLAKGSLDGRRILAEETVAQIFAASMVQGVGGPLQDPNDSAGLGCESYHFLRYRVIEKNGALDGVRTIVTLIPERGIGIAVLANKQVTVLPEAVRAEFLERELGPSGRDLQAQVRAEQADWNSLVQVPNPPSDAAPLARDLEAFAGSYRSLLYGDMRVTRASDGLAVHVGPDNYPGRLSHWSGDTFLLRFKDKDITPGLLTFRFSAGKLTGLDVIELTMPPGGDLGHFDFVSR